VNTRYLRPFPSSLQRKIGGIDSTAATDIERSLFAGFKKENDQGKFYEGQELFAAWRAEAKTQGWGPEQVDSFLREAGAERIRADSNPLTKMRAAFSDWLQRMQPSTKSEEKQHVNEQDIEQDNELTRSR
jgi:hypothetical protein